MIKKFDAPQLRLKVLNTVTEEHVKIESPRITEVKQNNKWSICRVLWSNIFRFKALLCQFLFELVTCSYFLEFYFRIIIHQDFPGSSDGEASAYNVGDPGLIPGSGRSSGEGNGNPLQYSCLENLMDGGAWQASVHGVAKSQTQMSDHFTH